MCLTCFENSVISSSKDSDEQTSPVTPLSLGVQVANSHFSKTSASRGKRGCLQNTSHSVRLQPVCGENNALLVLKHSTFSLEALSFFSLHNFYNEIEIKYIFMGKLKLFYFQVYPKCMVVVTTGKQS